MTPGEADRVLAGRPEIGSRVYSKNSRRFGVVKRISKSGARALVRWESPIGSSYIRLDKLNVV